MIAAAFASIALAFAGTVSAQASVAALVATLRGAPTQVDRIKALNDSDVSIIYGIFQIY